MQDDSRGGVELIPLQHRHVPAIVRLHCDALAGDFLPRLGPSFLATLYGSMLELDAAFGFVTPLDADDVSGFVIASFDSRTLFRRVIARRFFRLTAAVATAMLRQPSLIAHVVETFFYPSKEGKDMPPGELLVIAVRSEDRSKGIGAALIGRLDEAMRQRQINRYKVTVSAANEKAQRFYRKLGFALTGDFVMYRNAWNVFVREVT